MIWTEEENDSRQFNNLLHAEERNCKGCQWSGWEKGETLITCGHHVQNFTPNSFCAYWTDPNDKILVAYFKKRKTELRNKINRRKQEENDKKTTKIMSYSICIKCKDMVMCYEKYCEECVEKHRLKQDKDWHRNTPNSYKNSEQEFEKDKINRATKQITNGINLWILQRL